MISQSWLLRFTIALTLFAIVAYISFSALALLPEELPSAATETQNIEIAITGIFLRDEVVLPYSTGFLPELYEGALCTAGAISDYGGVFTAKLDGYEHLSSIATLAPKQVLNAMDDVRFPVNSVGKQITSDTSRFYGIVQSEYLEYLKLGESYTLATEHYEIELSLAEIGETQSDCIAIMLSCDTDMQSLMGLRKMTGLLRTHP